MHTSRHCEDPSEKSVRVKCSLTHADCKEGREATRRNISFLGMYVTVEKFLSSFSHTLSKKMRNLEFKRNPRICYGCEGPSFKFFIASMCRCDILDIFRIEFPHTYVTLAAPYESFKFL